MYNDQNNTDLKIDNESHAHLKEISAWTKFLAITGIIISIMLAIAGLAGGAIPNKMVAANQSPLISPAALAVIYEIAAAVYFFLSILLKRFSDKLKMALTNSHQPSLNDAFLNLKYVYRFLGIILIIYISLVAFVLIISIGSAIFMG
jgi:hypothetical protein